MGNIFLNDDLEIKLGDFGLATMVEYDGEKKRTLCGTPNYIAPEVCYTFKAFIVMTKNHRLVINRLIKIVCYLRYSLDISNIYIGG